MLVRSPTFIPDKMPEKGRIKAERVVDVMRSGVREAAA